MPWTEGIWASRVREICMHGLKRAEAAGHPAPPLLDCFPWFRKIEEFSTTDSTEGHGKWGSAFRLDSRWVISRATDALVDAEQILP